MKINPKHSIRRLTTAAVCLMGGLGVGILGLSNLGPGVPASASPTPVCNAGVCTVTFTTVGTGFEWTPPSGVTSASFVLNGAQGGEGQVFGGDGAEVTGSLTLSPGSSIFLDIGGVGASKTDGGTGGVNGGGNGSTDGGGGGGGATDIKEGGTGPVDRLLVAGGGGGGGAAGSYLMPDCSNTSGGDGGNADNDGTIGDALTTPDAILGGGEPGQAGNSSDQGAGGQGGTGPTTATDCSGDLNSAVVNGAAGVSGDANGHGGGGGTDAGGGGGGGYFGGGQGGGPATVEPYYASWGGGGGGSSAGPGVTAYGLLTDLVVVNDGNGEAVITYDAPLTTTTASPTTTTTTAAPTTTTTTAVPATTTTTAAPVVTVPTTPTGSSGAASPPAATPTSAADPSTLAFTGLNVLPLLIAGLSLILAGSLMLCGVNVRRAEEQLSQPDPTSRLAPLLSAPSGSPMGRGSGGSCSHEPITEVASSYMYATAWHNGGPPREPAGYGLKFAKVDRDRHFVSDWENIVLELEGAEPTTVTLSAAFWRSCSELRSADVGQWLLAADVAPWARGSPPGVVVTELEGNRFSARILKRKGLGR